MSNFPLSEAITAIVAGVIAWIFGGKQAAKSSMVDDAKKVLEMWQETNHNCQSELNELRAEIQAVRKAASEERQHFKSEMNKMQSEIKALKAYIQKIKKSS